MNDPASTLGRVAVLMGGVTAEREVSLKGGAAVLQALQSAGVDAFRVDIGEHPIQQLIDLKADRVFNMLHGPGVEDGTIPAILDMLGLPYTGSGLIPSAITMDKLVTKRVLRGSAIPTPDFMELCSPADCDRLLHSLGLPVFVKPSLEGSSVGITPVRQAENLLPAWEKARQYGAVFAERLIEGAEFTAGFLGHDILPLIQLETEREFYDYQAKYLSDDTIYTCPCGLDDDTIAAINRLVQQTIHVTGVRHWGRVDLMVDDSGRVWIIEVNTVPGMTDHSLIPMAARQAGFDMSQLVLKILQPTLQGNNDV